MTKKVAVIGLGMIGGSIGLALRESGGYEAYGYGRSSTVSKAIAAGAIIDGSDNLPTIAKECDILILATPPGAFPAILRSLCQHWQDRWILSDVGSIKAAVVHSVAEIFGYLPAGFVPAHPIAGTEKTGLKAANGDLFRDAKVVMVRHARQDRTSFDTVRSLWKAMGGEIVEMEVGEHDRIFAGVSHLPHILSYALVRCMIEHEDADRLMSFAAGGFEDFSRLASSSPAMWRDIALANSVEIITALERYERALAQIRRMIAGNDGDALMCLMQMAKGFRDDWLQGSCHQSRRVPSGEGLRVDE